MTEVPKTAAAWKKNAHHTVMCPSGTSIVMKIPDLPAMIETGTIPQHLLDAALGAASDPDQKPTRELIKQQREFTDLLTMICVIEPKLTEADLTDIPYEDKEFIVSVATRQRDLDVLGDHIGGLNKSEKFRRFRSLGEFHEDVEGL